MNTKTLIDAVLNYTDNVDASDADNTSRRGRILQYLQEIYDEVWNYRNWTFTQTSNTVTVAKDPTNYVALPTDFVDIGDHGGVYDVSTGDKLDEVPEQTLLRLREKGIFVATVPRIYAIFGQDPSTGVKRIHLPKLQDDTQLKIWYERLPPTLVDTTSSSNNLQFVPAQYHNTVLLAGTVYKVRKGKGDERDWFQRYMQGIAYMVTREKPRKSTPQRLPRAVIGKW